MMLENMIRKEVREMPPSGIRKYFDIVNEMEDVISLGVGEPDFVTPWNVREAGIYSLEQGDTHYSSNAGFIELREEIAKYLYRKFDLKYQEDLYAICFPSRNRLWYGWHAVMPIFRIHRFPFPDTWG